MIQNRAASDGSTQSDLPWLDRPNAPELLQERHDTLSAGDFDRLRQWERDGYVVLDRVFTEAQIDRLMSDVDELFWKGRRPADGVNASGVEIEPGNPVTLTHAELLAFPLERRLQARDRSAWRLNNVVRLSAAAAEIAGNATISRVVDLILGRRAEPRCSIGLWRARSQPLHQDNLQMPAIPLNMCVGIDVACDDVDPACGPVVFYPGSHKVPMWSGWTDYPETSLSTCDDETLKAYRAWAAGIVQAFPRRTLLSRKGDVFIWHGSLIHAGSAPTDPGRVRKSFVLHSFPDGCDKTDEIKAVRRRVGFGAPPGTF